MNYTEKFIGIDVSKKKLDVGFRPQQATQVYDYTKEGIAQLIKALKEIAPTLIVLEATGGVERDLVNGLVEASLPVVVINPRQIRDFAKALGLLAKTDSLDADVLAHYAQVVRPARRPFATAEEQQLKGWITRRRQIVEMSSVEKMRLPQTPKEIRPTIQKHLSWLKKEVKKLDKKITQHIQASSENRAKQELLCSAPSVGPVLSATLMAEMPELGTLSGKKIAALVGVAPYNQESGTWKGRKKISGGRKPVRSVLYMATLAGIRGNPVIKEFYRRLIKAGKVRKVAIVACMRKLLIILNAMVKHNTPWTLPPALVTA